MNTREIILAHYQRYPQMQLEDFVKLLYQNEFGGGHLISDERESLQRLESEWTNYQNENKGKDFAPTIEKIGNGCVRMHLDLLDGQISPWTLNRFFVCSANEIHGTIPSFEQKLGELFQCIDEKLLPFSKQEAVLFCETYKAKGYPPMSHSEVFRVHYHPAYRIVREYFATYLKVFQAIEQAMANSKEEYPILIAIDGKSGAGKSTLADWISKIYDCNVFHMDDFFLQPGQRTEQRLQEIGGNVDYERVKTSILDPLTKRENEFSYQLYSCKEQKLTDFVSVQRKQLNVIEGSYSQHPYLGQAYQIRIFLDLSKEEQKNRIIHRNGEQMYQRFEQEWIPKENAYFDFYQIAEQSNVYIH